MARKVFSPVFNNSIAPSNPPSSDGHANHNARRRCSRNCCRYAHELVTDPGQIATVLKRPNPVRDIVIIRAEFRPELPGAKPAWIVGLRNDSAKFTYDLIQAEATYLDEEGKVLETDKLLIRQKLAPGDEKLVGSVDFKSRGAARRGNLRITGAQEVR